MPTTTELTEDYISERRSIKDCLQKDLINYSALSRLIGKDLGIERKTSREAILVAARRYRDKISGSHLEDQIIELFKNSNVEIKNNIVIFTLDKGIYPDALIDIEKSIKKNKELFFSIEGTKTITVIVQQNNKKAIEQRFKKNLVKRKENLSLITITSEGIEHVTGAMYHLCGLFFEHDINIEETMSCHHDTLIVVSSAAIEKVIQFLRF